MKAVNTTWDLTPLYSSHSVWSKELKKELKTNYAHKFAPYHGKKTWSAKELKELLDTYFQIEQRVKKLVTWAHLFHDQETANTLGREAFSSSLFCQQRFHEASSWIEPMILQHSKEQLKAFVQHQNLALYKTYLSNLLRLKPHTLSSDQEKLFSLSGLEGHTPYKTFSALNDSDLVFPNVKDKKGKEHPLTHGTFSELIRSPDRILRQNAYTTLHGSYRSFQNSFAELLSGQMNRHVFEMKSHFYSSSLEASLFPKSIPQSIYSNLIETVREHRSTLHRYLVLRKKILQVDVLKPWDLYAPLISRKKEPLYEYEEAIQLVLDASKPLGKEYVDILKKGLTEKRWVDVYEKKSKRSGAYSSGCFDSPPYILLNYKGTLRDVYTLAHEAGHSMHSYLSRSRQPYHLSDYEIFVAEVASTLNEELLTALLLQKAQNNSEKMNILLEQVEAIRATFFRQTLFAEFELFMHESAEKGIPLTSALLEQKYKELNELYYGPTLDCTKELCIEWARIPHFYYNFYVYQYATGITAAHALKKGLDENKESARKKYLHFLSSGSEKDPITLLKQAGIDMRKKEPYVHLVHTFSSLVSQIEHHTKN